MTLPLHIAIKLQQMLEGINIPVSAMKHSAVQKMLEDAVLQKRQHSKTKAVLFVENASALKAYLHNHFGIFDLDAYINKYNDSELTRAEAITVSGNSKLKSIRTFKGFLVNSYQPIKATLNNQLLIIQPAEGSYTFISDYNSFVPDSSVTIVGIENPENFRYIQKQQHLFPHISALFVCRYPQSNDLIRWLLNLPNKYLHFGDLDFEGIRIYLNEYKKHLGNRANFFVPSNTEELLQQFGNRNLYNKQLHHAPAAALMQEEMLRKLLTLLHKHKKVLEQEIFIKVDD